MLYGIASNNYLYIKFWGVISTFGQLLRQNYIIHWVNGSFLALGGYDSNDYCFCIHISTPSEPFAIFKDQLKPKGSLSYLGRLKLAYYLSSFCHQLVLWPSLSLFLPSLLLVLILACALRSQSFYLSPWPRIFAFYLWNSYMKAGKYMKKLVNVWENSIRSIVK